MNNSPRGFILSDAAMYAFECQEVYPDLLSFAVAIPDHLKQLFLVPVTVEPMSIASVASRVAFDDSGAGYETDSADLFGTKTFVVENDPEPTVTDSDPGSMFDIDGYWGKTHQDDGTDENWQVPSDTSYMSDIDITNYWSYPYRSEEKPRHSSLRQVAFFKLSLKPERLITEVPKKIKENAEVCSVSLVSYDKRGRIFSFKVDCGNKPKNVRASLTSLNEVAMTCSCPFWRWNGPEFNAKSNKFLLGKPNGKASPPNVRDPDREFWLCKHTFAVLKRLDTFVQQIVDENWGLDDDDLLREIDEEWDRLIAVSEETSEELEEENPEIEVKIEEEEPEEEPEVEEEPEEELKK